MVWDSILLTATEVESLSLEFRALSDVFLEYATLYGETALKQASLAAIEVIVWYACAFQAYARSSDAYAVLFGEECFQRVAYRLLKGGCLLKARFLQ